MNDTTEHDKIRALNGANQTVGDFIEWLRENGYTICRFEKLGREYDEDGDVVQYAQEGYFPTNRTTEQFITDHFGIDLDKLEAEKQAMLDELAKENTK